VSELLGPHADADHSRSRLTDEPGGPTARLMLLPRINDHLGSLVGDYEARLFSLRQRSAKNTAGCALCVISRKPM
jgi:hypothetical protein